MYDGTDTTGVATDSPAAASGGIAPLRNVGLVKRLLDQAMERDPRLPGIVVAHGPSGFGKSWAAAFARNMTDACYVECRSRWTPMALTSVILRGLSITPKRAIWQMIEQIGDELAKSGRPLIVDEVDHIVNARMVEVVRDIYEASGAPILLIGEEYLPQKLERWERVHNRILDAVAVQPADLDDARQLALLYAPGVAVHDDLLTRVVTLSEGRVRRVCVNLHRIKVEAGRLGAATMDRATWGDRALHTGEFGRRRGAR